MLFYRALDREISSHHSPIGPTEKSARKMKISKQVCMLVLLVWERLEFMNTQNGTKKSLNKINRTQKKEKRKFMTERRNMGPFWIIVIPVQVIHFLNNCMHSWICVRILVFFKGGNLFKVGFYESKINKTCKSWGCV